MPVDRKRRTVLTYALEEGHEEIGPGDSRNGPVPISVTYKGFGRNCYS